jgi:nitrosocyanin
MAKPIIRNLAVVAAILGIILLGTSPGRAADESAGATVKSFTLVSVMVDDAKIWLPSSIIVEKGDHVKLTLKNMIPGAANQHGFSIPAYGITEVVTSGTPKTVEFTADKAGVFPYTCQLHPGHIGGQLLVIHKMPSARPAAK